MDEPRLADPTPLTTAQLLGAITALEKLMSQRMDAMERERLTIREILNLIPAEREKQINHLRELMEERITSLKELLQTGIEDSQRAIVKAEAATEKRFENVNEFRGQLNDMVSSLMPRNESTARWQSLSEKVDTLIHRVDKNEGSGSGMKQGWSLLVGGIALVATLLVIFTFFADRGRSASSAAPQIVYVPPAGSAAVSPTPAPAK